MNNKRRLITTGYHLPYNPKLKERSRILRKKMTFVERKIWHEYLKNFPLTVLRQKPLDNYIVDFYIPKLKLVIEIDGPSHSERGEKEYDSERTNALKRYGLKVLRFWNHEVLENLEGVCEAIGRELKKSPLPPFAKGGLKNVCQTKNLKH